MTRLGAMVFYLVYLSLVFAAASLFLLSNFLSDRPLRVRVGSILSEACALENGVPQGSILSVTLFAVAINSVISVVPDGVHSSLYVDDLSNFRLTGFSVGLLNAVSGSQP